MFMDLYNKLISVINATLDPLDLFGLSNAEKVEKIVRKINEMITHGKDVDEVMQEIADDLKELNDNIVETVQTELQNMYDNGELQTLVENVTQPFFENLTNEINTQFSTLSAKVEEDVSDIKSYVMDFARVDTLNFERIHRDIFAAKNYKPLESVSFNPAFLQGAHVYDLNGNTNIIGAFIDPRLDDDAGAMLLHYSSLKTTSHQNSAKLSIGHANGITYNPNDDCYYVEPSTEYVNGEGQESTHIFKINANTFALSSQSVSVYSPDIAYYNGNLYLVNTHDNYKVYTYDFSTGQSTYVSQLDVQNVGVSTFYNFDVADGKVFMVDTTGKRIEVFDLETGEYLWTYNVPLYDKQHRFLIREIEGISVMEDGRLYINTIGYNGLQSQTQELMASCFVGNFKNNNPEPPIKYSDTITGGNVVHVLPTSHTASDLKFCDNPLPDGTAGNAFETLNEAVDYINANPNFTRCRIRLGHDHFLALAMSSTKSIDIISWDFDANKRPDENFFFGGLFVESSPNLMLWFVDLWCSSNMSEFVGTMNAFQSNVISYGIATHTTATQVMYQPEYDVSFECSYYRYSNANDTFSTKQFSEANTHFINNSLAVSN